MLCDGDDDRDTGEALTDGDGSGDALADDDSAEDGDKDGEPDAVCVGGAQCTPS